MQSSNLNRKITIQFDSNEFLFITPSKRQYIAVHSLKNSTENANLSHISKKPYIDKQNHNKISHVMANNQDTDTFCKIVYTAKREL